MRDGEPERTLASSSTVPPGSGGGVVDPWSARIPDEAGAGGAGNWCIIVYQPNDGPRQAVFSKNVGGGGLHSEPNAMNKVPKRELLGLFRR